MELIFTFLKETEHPSLRRSARYSLYFPEEMTLRDLYAECKNLELEIFCEMRDHEEMSQWKLKAQENHNE